MRHFPLAMNRQKWQRVRDVPFATLKPWDIFLRSLQPTPDEVSAMIQDLRARFDGEWRPVVQCAGVCRKSLYSWVNGDRVPPPSGRRAVWLVWCMVCRPGSIRTTFDLATSGRFTARRRGDPATAGKLSKSGHVWIERADDMPDEDDEQPEL